MSGPKRAGKRPALAETPFVSVVLPVRNEGRFITDTLNQLKAQRYPRNRVEFLVCDGRSEDCTRQIVREMAEQDSRIRLIDNPLLRSSAGRNAGFRAARGEIVLVVDGHVQIPDERLLANVVECFQKSGADCLGRPQPLIAEKGHPWSEAIRFARSSPLGHHPGSFIYSDYEGPAPAASMGAAYRSYVFEEIGYVDESFDACEDLEFNTRLDKAGLHCYTSSALTVRYFARTSPRKLFQQLYRYGFGRFKYLLLHPDRLTLGQIASPALVVGLVSIPLLWLLARPVALAASAMVVLYSLTILAGAVLLSIRTIPGHFTRYLVILPIVHLAVGVGFLASVLRGGRPSAPRGPIEAANSGR